MHKVRQGAKNNEAPDWDNLMLAQIKMNRQLDATTRNQRVIGSKQLSDYLTGQIDSRKQVHRLYRSQELHDDMRHRGRNS